MKTDAIVPAWNEANKIGRVLEPLIAHPDICHVWVCVDSKTTDNTAEVAKQHHASVIAGNYVHGKGQTVAPGLQVVDTATVLLCDADITGLTREHISGLIYPFKGLPMVVGVPDFPDWQAIPASFAKRSFIDSWPWVSGERCVPIGMARHLPLYGYLMETQLNRAALEAGRKIIFQRLPGVRSELNLSARRLADLHRHLAVGRRVGYV